MRRLFLAVVSLLLGCATAYEKGPTLVPLAPAGTTDRVAKPRRFALLVGIDRYEDERFTPLRFAGADARALGGALETFDEVEVCTRPEETTRAALLAAIARIAKKAQHPQDTVLIYLSGHGSLGQRAGKPLSRYIVTSDSRLDLLDETAISVDTLTRTLSLLPAKRVALILAACHSGKGKSQLPDELAEALAQLKAPPLPPLTERSEALFVMTAAAFSEAARESPELQHDVYTHFFLLGLEKGDADADGSVTVSEAHDFAREQTYVFTNGAQRPSLESEVVGRDPIVLRGTPSRAAKPVVYSYARSAEGLSLVVNGAKKGTLPGGIPLEPGRHAVELRDAHSGALVYRGQVELAEGDRLELAGLIVRPRLRLALETGVVAPLAAATRTYLPALLGGGLRVGLEDGLFKGTRVGLGLGLFGGAGTQAAFGEQLAFDARLERVSLDGGYSFALSRRWSVTPGLSVGAVWAQRTLARAHFRAEQGLRGTMLAGAIRVEGRPAPAWSVGGRVELGALRAQLGTAATHAVGALALEGSWRF